MSDLYETSDLGLASALSCKGFHIQDLDRSNPHRIVFRFRSDARVENIVDDYWSGALLLPPAALFTHQKLLKQRIYSHQKQ